MRILFLAPYVPSPLRVRPFQLIRALARQGHTVQFVAQARDAQELRQAETLRAVGNVSGRAVPLSRLRPWLNCSRALFTGEPLWVAHGRSREFFQAARQAWEATRAEVVHVEHVRSLSLLPLLQEIKDAAGRPGLVFDGVDCISELFRQYARGSSSLHRRLLYRRETTRMERFEPAAVSLFDRAVITTASERDALAGLMGKEGDKVKVVPNGVDLEYFYPTEEAAQPDTLLFTGKMSFYNNAEAARYFIREVFPLVKARRPAARLIVAGADPPADLQRLAARPDIEITGYVEDLRPHFRRAAVVVCPMLTAVGVQNKALEAMAMGKPVVATPLSCRALNARIGEELLAADGPEAFARAVVDLLEKPEAAKHMGRQARAYVEREHSWEESARRLAAIYAEAVALSR